MNDLHTLGGPDDCVGAAESTTPCRGPIHPYRSRSGATWSYRCATHQTEYVDRIARQRRR